MKNSKKMYTGYCAAFALALPLAMAPLPAAAAIPFPAYAAAAAESAGISDVRQINPTTVEILYADGKMLQMDFYGENIFRLFRDDAGGIMRDPQATPAAQILVNSARRAPGQLHIEKEGAEIVVSTPKVAVTFDRKSGLMTVKNLETGETVIEEAQPVAFEKDKTTLTFKAHAGEYFYGGGVQNGRFSHKGKAIAIENTNNWVDGGVASPTPFYWSTKGYGVMWHTFRPGTYDFGSTTPDRVVLSHSETYLDAFVMVNNGPVELLNDFYQLTGNPVLLPKFGFYEGHLNAYNRDYWTEAADGSMVFEDGKRYKESQKDNGGVRESLNGESGPYQFSARAVVDRYAKADMPLGWILPNDGYASGYGQDTTLDGNVRNLRSFSDYTRSKGVEVGLWTQSDLYPKAGVEPLLQRDIVKEVRDGGVRVLKTDVAWVGAGYSFGLNGVSNVANVMSYYGSNARPFIISVDGWAGTQRYAGIWTGDQTGGDWEYIRYHIPTFIGAGLSGQPNITNDVDGIFGGKNVPVNVREYQWKTFTPMELNMDGWGTNPKYPQALGEPAASINRSYLKLKSELIPYTYSIAREAVNGKPIIRAMFLDYPNDYTYGTATQYQFLYGPSFLVAPIYKETKMDKEGNDVRNGIYLPEGKWVDYYNGDVYEGNRIINNFDAPIWKLPVFVKSDAIIPMTQPNNNPSQIPADFRAYEIYAEAGTAFNEYDDDGKTQEYLNGRAARTLIESSVDGDELTVTVSPTIGSFSGFEKNKQTEFRINVSQQPEKVTAKVGGKKVKFTQAASLADFQNNSQGNVYFYDEQPNLNRFATPGSDFEKQTITKNPQLLVRLAKTDITANGVELTVKGFAYAPADRLLVSTGQLEAPQASFQDKHIGAFELTASWPAVSNADYYEIEYDGMLYSTIRDCQFTFDGLQPETTYTFKVRAVNRSGKSEWKTFTGTTKSNPLEFAIQGIRAQNNKPDQGGQGIGKLFDFDEKSVWHTSWKNTPPAVPFELVLDLRGINQLDRFDYIPREDAGNGTLLKGSVAYSSDRQNWSEPVAFEWKKDNSKKTFQFSGNPSARYLKLNITEAVGNFGSGAELYVFKVADTETILQGDINRDKRIDENDLTSYMNYTGLRQGDADFEYISSGDINHNGLIDAYDISIVTTELDGGVRNSNDSVAGQLTLTPNKKTFQAGDTLEIKVSGKGLHYVNGLSFALPYDAQTLEFAKIEPLGMKDMVNLTNDRLHTNGQKALYPTFVNRGNNFLLDDGDHELFVIKFVAKKAGKYDLKPQDGLLVDRNLGTAKCF